MYMVTCTWVSYWSHSSMVGTSASSGASNWGCTIAIAARCCSHQVSLWDCLILSGPCFHCRRRPVNLWFSKKRWGRSGHWFTWVLVSLPVMFRLESSLAPNKRAQLFINYRICDLYFRKKKKPLGVHVEGLPRDGPSSTKTGPAWRETWTVLESQVSKTTS